ncbi:hypothetical protein DIPPA_15101 [Diplonema papillatum]|nr:hypothetical protein DIPPA_15101 [Diplonema papillatum]|eukprot:gene1258-1946_t
MDDWPFNEDDQNGLTFDKMLALAVSAVVPEIADRDMTKAMVITRLRRRWKRTKQATSPGSFINMDHEEAVAIMKEVTPAYGRQITLRMRRYTSRRVIMDEYAKWLSRKVKQKDADDAQRWLREREQACKEAARKEEHKRADETAVAAYWSQRSKRDVLPRPILGRPEFDTTPLQKQWSVEDDYFYVL